MTTAQLTLDGRDTRFHVTKISGWMDPCFGAKCAACGAWLTKWDFSEDDAASCAAHELDRADGLGHHCSPFLKDTP